MNSSEELTFSEKKQQVLYEVIGRKISNQEKAHEGNLKVYQRN